jgi:hypothetical protein
MFSAMIGSDLQTCASTQRCMIMVDREVVIGRFWRATEAEEIAAFRAGIDAVATTRGRVGILAVIDADAAPPTKETRHALGKMLGDYQRRLIAWSGCVCGEGLGAMSKRTMMRVILSLGGLRCVWRVTGHPEEAAHWLAEQMGTHSGQGVDAEGWVRALGQMREGLVV